MSTNTKAALLIGNFIVPSLAATAIGSKLGKTNLTKGLIAMVTASVLAAPVAVYLKGVSEKEIRQLVRKHEKIAAP